MSETRDLTRQLFGDLFPGKNPHDHTVALPLHLCGMESFGWSISSLDRGKPRVHPPVFPPLGRSVACFSEFKGESALGWVKYENGLFSASSEAAYRDFVADFGPACRLTSYVVEPEAVDVSSKLFDQLFPGLDPSQYIVALPLGLCGSVCERTGWSIHSMSERPRVYEPNPREEAEVVHGPRFSRFMAVSPRHGGWIQIDHGSWFASSSDAFDRFLRDFGASISVLP